MRMWKPIPEAPINPPEEKTPVADCNCEVSYGERTWGWEGDYICNRCLLSKWNELTEDEQLDLLAEHFGCDYKEVN